MLKQGDKMKELQDLLDIIWGTEKPKTVNKKKKKRTRDKKGRYTGRKK